MSLFKEKKQSLDKVQGEKKKKVIKPSVKQAPIKVGLGDEKLFSILRRIRITEKATDMSTDSNVYVFEVSQNANKIEIGKAIEKFYKVRPRKINIVKIPSKNVVSRGKKGVKTGGKKAYVFLKEGDKIENV